MTDDDRLALLSGVERAQVANDDDLVLDGYTNEQTVAMFSEARDRNLVDAGAVQCGDDRVLAFRRPALLPDGVALLAALRAAHEQGESLPNDPVEVWRELRKVAEPHSPFARAISAAMGDLESRGLAQSGVAVSRAMEVAYDHGYTWHAAERRFVLREGAEADVGVSQAETRRVEIFIRDLTVVVEQERRADAHPDVLAYLDGIDGQLQTLVALLRAPKLKKRLVVRIGETIETLALSIGGNVLTPVVTEFLASLR
jgi:hypothetical protein